MRRLLLVLLIAAVHPMQGSDSFLVHCVLWDAARPTGKESNYLRSEFELRHALFVVREDGAVVNALIFGKRAAVLPLFDRSEVWIAEDGPEDSTILIKASLPGLKRERETKIPYSLYKPNSVFRQWLKQPVLIRLNDFILFRAITGQGEQADELAISLDLKTGSTENFLSPVRLSTRKGEFWANFFSFGEQAVVIYPVGTGYFVSLKTGRIEATRFPPKSRIELPYGNADFYSLITQSANSHALLAIKTSNGHPEHFSLRILNLSENDGAELMTIPAADSDPSLLAWDAESMIGAFGAQLVEGDGVEKRLAKCTLTILNLAERKPVRTLEMLNLGAVSVKGQSVFYGEGDRLMVVKGNLKPVEIARFPGRIAEIFPIPK